MKCVRINREFLGTCHGESWVTPNAAERRSRSTPSPRPTSTRTLSLLEQDHEQGRHKAPGHGAQSAPGEALPSCPRRRALRRAVRRGTRSTRFCRRGRPGAGGPRGASSSRAVGRPLPSGEKSSVDSNLRLTAISASSAPEILSSTVNLSSGSRRAWTLGMKISYWRASARPQYWGNLAIFSGLPQVPEALPKNSRDLDRSRVSDFTADALRTIDAGRPGMRPFGTVVRGG